ncbi:MAG: TauD/TfdA family dioxygenase, partial [Rhodospirillales bacterium]|nr:TauD/TfdA family dioxygenase [Rhodospirillales bacterium]
GGLRFHTDRTDVVGLLCVRQARAGGVSRLCSTGAIHNAFLERRPDLLEVLFQDFWRSRLGEESKDPSTVYPLPILGLRDGKLTSHYSLTFIEAAELVPGVPKLTAAQREAIDMLMAVADELSFEMTLAPGDLQLINSHVTYHGRTAFEDDAATGHDRLLLRLWLTVPNNRALPEGHEVLWREIAAGAPRGGIAQVPA